MTEPINNQTEADELLTEEIAETEDNTPVRPEKSTKTAAVIYFCLALVLLVCMGLFAAVFGRSWLLLAFVPAIAAQLLIGFYYLDMYNKALNKYEADMKAFEETQKQQAEE